MSVNGKRDQFIKEDLPSVAGPSDLKGVEKVIQKFMDALTR